MNNIKEKYEPNLSPTDRSNLYGIVSKLLADVKQHVIHIQEKAQQVKTINPV